MAERSSEQAATGFSVTESPLCDHCGHVRGLHGRNHGCISSFADGKPGQSCRCPGFVRPSTSPASTTEDRSAGRWCETCQQHGSHHTDRHDDMTGDDRG